MASSSSMASSMPSTSRDSSLPPVTARRPFAAYVQRCREEYEREHGPDHPPDFSFSQFIFGCSDRWQSMSAEERSPFVKETEEDQKRYDIEYKAYVKRMPKKPKQELAPFVYYFRAEKANFQKKYPNLSYADLAVKIGDAWMDAKIDVRRRYEAIAEKAARNDD